MTETKPKRRGFKFRFRFSLRTLFVVVTAFAVLFGWIGWNVYEVQQRKQFLKYIAKRNGVVRAFDTEVIYPPWRPNQMPWMWRLLGAEPVGYIMIRKPFTTDDAKTVGAWFPEAQVKFMDSDGKYVVLQ